MFVSSTDSLLSVLDALVGVLLFFLVTDLLFSSIEVVLFLRVLICLSSKAEVGCVLGWAVGDMECDFWRMVLVGIIDFLLLSISGAGDLSTGADGGDGGESGVPSVSHTSALPLTGTKVSGVEAGN